MLQGGGNITLPQASGVMLGRHLLNAVLEWGRRAFSKSGQTCHGLGRMRNGLDSGWSQPSLFISSVRRDRTHS